jgi:hypothetical protein
MLTNIIHENIDSNFRKSAIFMFQLRAYDYLIHSVKTRKLHLLLEMFTPTPFHPYPALECIFNLLLSTNITYKKVFGRKGDNRTLKKGYQTHTLPEPVYLNTLKKPRNRFQGIDSASLCSLACRYVKQGCCTGPPGWEPIPERLKGTQA